MGTDLELTYLIELVDTDIKTAMIPVFHMFRKLEKRLNLEVQTWKIKKTQAEMLKMTTKMSVMENYYNGTIQKKGLVTFKIQ